MVCDEVKRIAYFYLDGTLGANRQKAFTDHMKECSTCDERVLFHRRIRQFLHARLTVDAAPAQLRERVCALWKSPSPDIG